MTEPQPTLWGDSLEPPSPPQAAQADPIREPRPQVYLDCGCLDLGCPHQGGRPFQCLHEWDAWIAAGRPVRACHA
jgi:hypothetical protein